MKIKIIDTFPDSLPDEFLNLVFEAEPLMVSNNSIYTFDYPDNVSKWIVSSHCVEVINDDKNKISKIEEDCIERTITIPSDAKSVTINF